MWWISRVLWLVIAHDLLEYKNMDDIMGNLFSLFVQHGKQFWNSLLEYFGLSKWRPQKKFSRSYLKRIRMEEPRQKAFLMTWKSLNWKKSSQKLHHASSLQETSSFKNVFMIFLVWASAYSQAVQGKFVTTSKGGKNISDTLRLVCHFFVLTTFWLLQNLWFFKFFQF